MQLWCSQRFYFAPKLGITAMLFFIIVGQLITAATIDHFGLIGMPIREVNIHEIYRLNYCRLWISILFLWG